MRNPQMEQLASRLMDEKKRRDPAYHPEGGSTLAEPTVMPNEGEVWVHPLSLEEESWAVAQAAKEVRDLGLVDRQEAEWYIQTRARIYETIAACRVGSGPDAERVYTRNDARRLRTDPAYRQAVARVVEISSRLGQDDWTKDALTDFFDGILAPLERCCSLPNNEDYWSCSGEILTDLISRLRLTRQRKTLLLATSEETEPREDQEMDDGNGVEIHLNVNGGSFEVPVG